MTGRDGTKGNNRRRMSIVGGAVGAFAAAAAMATGSAVTAAPAKADIDALLDPIIQPIITSLSDALVGFDPAAATDLTTWTDSLLASLNSLDIGAAVPASADPAAALAASDPTPATADIPITMAEDTEPTVQATVDGASNTLLVDTGSSGLVIPWEDLGSNPLSALLNVFELGVPTGISESGYSGGVDYLYLTYNDVPVDYGSGAGALDTTNDPVDVEILSWPTGSGSPASFEDFLADNDVTGILGIGDAANAGPTESPFEALGYSGVTVDLPQGELVVGENAGTPIGTALSGAPTPDDDLTETVTTSTGALVGTGSVSDDVDSGGVYGTIPSTIDGSTVAQGDKITVSYDGTTLYSYTVGTDTDNTDEAPELFTGASGTNEIDSGVEPYLTEPIYISYGGTDGAITFDEPGSGTA
jgi:hypothetical protein